MSLSIFAALAAAAGYGGGSVVQAMASTQAAGLKVLRRPAYAVGTAITLVAWVFSLVALKYLPLLTVQTILASALVVTVLLDRAVFGTRLRRIDVLAALGVTGALAVIALGTGSQSRVATPSWFGFSMLILLLALLVATVVTYRQANSSVQAVLSGLASAGLAMCARGAHGSGGSSGWIDFLLTPMAWLTIGFAILSSVTFSRAVERGTVGPARALVGVAQVVVPGIVGVTILGDTVRTGWGLTILLAVLVALAGCAVLATRPVLTALVPAPSAGATGQDTSASSTIFSVEDAEDRAAAVDIALDLAALERVPAPVARLVDRTGSRQL